VILNKKIRSINKKISKIAAIEEKVTKGAKVNEEQQKIIDNKDNTEKTLQEFENVKAQFIKIQQQEEKIQKRLKKKSEAAANLTTSETKDNVAKNFTDQSRAIVTLLHLSQLFEQGGTKTRNNFWSAQEEARNSGKLLLVNSNSDLDNLVHVAKVVVTSPINTKEGIDKATEVVSKLLSQSDDIAVNGITYKRIREQLDEINASSFLSAHAAQEIEQQGEKTEKGEETELPSSINEVSPDEEHESGNTGEVAEDPTVEGENHVDENGKKAANENREGDSKRGGFRGRNRGRGQGRGRGRYVNERDRRASGRGSFRPRDRGNPVPKQ